MPSQEIVQTEENILVFDNIFSRGYGFSPQVLTRIPQLSIEAKGLYSYFSSFAGQGGVAFPSTSTILAEMNISKNRFYKYRSELEAWGFITVDIENTRHGRRTVYHLPVEPKPTDKVHELIDEATKANRICVVLNGVDMDGYPLFAAIEPNATDLNMHKGKQVVAANVVRTVFGKDNLIAHLEHKVPASEVIYFDKEKSQDLERLAGIQFPRYYSSLSFNTIIQQPRCICNSKVPQHCDMEAEPAKKALEKGSVKEVSRKEATEIDQIGDAIVEERPHSPAVLQKGGDGIDGR